MVAAVFCIHFYCDPGNPPQSYKAAVLNIFHLENQILLPVWRARAQRFLHVSEKDRGAKYQISFLPVVSIRAEQQHTTGDAFRI